MGRARVKRKLAAVLAADVVSYSRLMGGDEAGTLARLQAIRRDVFDPAAAAHGGRVVKLMGDGALVEFASAVDALSFAIEFQKAVQERDAGEAEDRRMRFRIGIHVGDVIVDGSDIYGDGVNVAARIESLAEAGGIFLSRAVAEQVEGKVDVRLIPLGEKALRNISRPIEVFAVGNEDRPVPAVPDKLSIAVLAFDNMTGDAEQDYFSDGISEDIITDLSKLGQLQVIARNSSFVYKKRSVSVKEVGRELGVRYVLEGSVRKVGTRVRVTAQLVDTATGGHVWADRFDRDLTDIFAVQDELTREIVAALQVRLTPGEKRRLGQRRAVPIEAYQLYLRGREQTWIHTRTANRVALELLERAVAIEPNYAAARACIAFLHGQAFVNAWVDDPEASLARSRTLAEEVVAMDPDEPLGHFALSIAWTWQRDLDRSLATARRCLELAPSSVEGHLAVAHPMIFMDRDREAIEHIEVAMRLDPLCPEIALQFLAEAHMSLGEYAAAAKALQDRIARNAESPTAQALLASAFGHLGRVEEARRAWAETLRLDPDWSIERRRRILPFRDPAQFERRLDGLRKAGIVP